MSEREDWAKHPLTRQVRRTLEQALETSLTTLINKAKSSTDPDMRGAYEKYLAVQATLSLINQKDKVANDE